MSAKIVLTYQKCQVLFETSVPP